MLVDLSVALSSGMPVYPGDPEVTIEPALTVADDGVNLLRVHMSSQVGTHVDAPYHVDDALPPLDALPLERFVGEATVVDLRGMAPRAPIPAAAIRGGLREGTILLVATGWAALWGTDDYHTHPYLSPEAARVVVDAGVRTIGIDAMSVDPTPAEEFPAHRVLCGAHAVIVENLTGLDVLLEAQEAGRRIEVFMLPIRLTAADGAPVRAVARIS